jgi:hypothetical protein
VDEDPDILAFASQNKYKRNNEYEGEEEEEDIIEENEAKNQIRIVA